MAGAIAILGYALPTAGLYGSGRGVNSSDEQHCRMVLFPRHFQSIT